MRWLAALLLLHLVASQAALAAGPRQLGIFDAWSAHEIRNGKARVCYMHATPGLSRGKYTQRGPTYMEVTHRTADRARNEVSLVAGYGYNDGSEVAVEIDGRKFSLFTKGDGAWARDAKADAALVAAMRAGKSMTVRGTSSRGTVTTDTYSLKGFAAAHKAIGKACGIR